MEDQLGDSNARWVVKTTRRDKWMPCTPELCAFLERISLIDMSPKPILLRRNAHFEIPNSSFFISPIHILKLDMDAKRKGLATIVFNKKTVYDKSEILAHRPPPFSMLELTASCHYGLSLYPPPRAIQIVQGQW